MSEQTTLYKFYNEKKELLYVGITSQKDDRWSQHKASKPWWKQHKYVVSEHFDTREEALIAEEHSIKVEMPKYNIKHNEQNLDFVVTAFNLNTYQGQSLFFDLLSQRWLMGIGKNSVHFHLLYESPEDFRQRSIDRFDKSFTFFFSDIDYYKTKQILDNWEITCGKFAYGKKNSYWAVADKTIKTYAERIDELWLTYCNHYAQQIIDERNSGQSSFLLPPWDPSLKIEDFNLLIKKGSYFES